MELGPLREPVFQAELSARPKEAFKIGLDAGASGPGDGNDKSLF